MVGSRLTDETVGGLGHWLDEAAVQVRWAWQLEPGHACCAVSGHACCLLWVSKESRRRDSLLIGRFTQDGFVESYASSIHFLLAFPRHRLTGKLVFTF